MTFGIPDEAIDKVCSVFVRYPQVDVVLLYGSRAKGTYKDGSDIDLTVKGSGLNLSVINHIENDLDDLLLPWTFDLSLYSQIKNPDLLAHIDRVGIVFYPQGMH
jgi:predicted nucleotidyltransferase